MNARVLNERGWTCPTGDEMGRIDRDAIERLGLPARLLMENAGRAVAAALRQHFPGAQRPLVVCGGGNNGGDGFVIARVLRDWDDRCKPVVLALGEGVRRSPEAQANLELLLNSDVEVIVGSGSKEIEACLTRCDLVVDAVFGVGLQRPVEGELARTLQTLRGCGLPILAVDLPSGISSDTGAVLGVELEAELILQDGTPTGIKAIVRGNTVENKGLSVVFNPMVLSDATRDAATQKSVLGQAQGWVGTSLMSVENWYPIKGRDFRVAATAVVHSVEFLDLEAPGLRAKFKTKIEARRGLLGILTPRQHLSTPVRGIRGTFHYTPRCGGARLHRGGQQHRSDCHQCFWRLARRDLAIRQRHRASAVHRSLLELDRYTPF